MPRLGLEGLHYSTCLLCVLFGIGLNSSLYSSLSSSSMSHPNSLNACAKQITKVPPLPRCLQRDFPKAPTDDIIRGLDDNDICKGFPLAEISVKTGVAMDVHLTFQLVHKCAGNKNTQSVPNHLRASFRKCFHAWAKCPSSTCK